MSKQELNHFMSEHHYQFVDFEPPAGNYVTIPDGTKVKCTSPLEAGKRLVGAFNNSKREEK